jgi:phosphoribosylformylglycinamidine synthase
VQKEQSNLKNRKVPDWKLTYDVTMQKREEDGSSSSRRSSGEKKVKVGVIRQEGSNGDREMCAAFLAAGMEPYDVAVSDLLEKRITLDNFQGLVFVGGFSYADVLDSGKGWAGVIKFNPEIFEMFEAFRNRTDTFSLGVCNGCQLMALLGWVPTSAGEEQLDQPRFIENESGKFESRFSSVKICKSPSIMLEGMEDSTLGIWVAHGEGRVKFPSAAVKEKVDRLGLVPIRYVDDEGQATTEYPFNPNGSEEGIAGLCSEDGRHLAMMPHPERLFMEWQWPWMPENLKCKDGSGAGPWLKMFQNAKVWALKLQ